MLETNAHDAPRPSAELRRLWSFTLDAYHTRRRPTREVRVGDVGIGAANPIRVQSMTVADTMDTEAVVAEIEALHAAGSEIVRVTAPNRTCAENLAEIRARLRRRGVRVPLVADIHFTPQAALIAAQHVEKVRINPGNYADRKHFARWEYTDAEYDAELERLEAAFRPLVLRCKERGIAMRIGTNHGSLSDRIMNRYGDTPLGMVESALEFVRICEHHGYRDLVLSMKASDVKVMIQAYRLLAARMRELGMDYPFHLGVTEAGGGLAARIKSAIGIATLLEDGLGDTVRVSLTEDSLHELPLARALAQRYSRPAPAAAPPADDEVPPPWDPYCFQRRAVVPVGTGAARLATDQPPRVELVVRLAPDPEGRDSVAGVQRILVEVGRAAEPADLLLLALPPAAAPDLLLPALAALAPLARARLQAGAAPLLGLEVPAEWLDEPGVRALTGAWARLSLRLAARRIAPEPEAWEAHLGGLPGLQWTLTLAPGELEDAAFLGRTAGLVAARQRSGAWPAGALALERDDGALVTPQAVRRWLAASPSGPASGLVLRGPAVAPPARLDAHLDARDLWIAVATGALLSDGTGDALQLEAGADPATACGLAAEILQATRLRLTKADFIACPSCGRTQFDLQTTTARIEARLRHLQGLKIAVMGCIVNGPGEMADADFGYVGSGPGRIDLYVGRTRVARNVPQAEAVDQLVELIRQHGRWAEPPALQP
jgi:(E)-4-hydroxy-3-methylbut-2-enyl-diphosphate synthase